MPPYHSDVRSKWGDDMRLTDGDLKTVGMYQSGPLVRSADPCRQQQACAKWPMASRP